MAYNEASLLEWKSALAEDPFTSCAIIADIELTDWEPIESQGYGKSCFSGTLYGNNCTISNLTDTFISSNDGGEIENLNFVIDITTGAQFGVILRNFGQINNCKVSGEISVPDGASAIGGISAYNSKDIIACYSDVAITVESTGDGGSVYIGGIAGNNKENGTINGTITASYFTGSIRGTISGGYVGGIAATNYDESIISACYSTGTLPTSTDDRDRVGGIVGHNRATITASYWSGDTTNGVANGDDSGATQVVSSWEEPMEAMNTELSDSGIAYEYVKNSGNDNVPLVIKPKA